MPPQHPWHGRIPNQGSWRKQTSSDHQASLLCCQQNPQYRHTQWTALLSPGTSPKSQTQGFPKLGTVSVCLQPECALWGRMAGAAQYKCYKYVIYKRSDLFTCHPTAVNSVLNLSHLQELQSFTEIFSIDLKPSELGNCISKDYYSNSSSSLIKIILHFVSRQKLLMNIREGMRKIIT